MPNFVAKVSSTDAVIPEKSVPVQQSDTPSYLESRLITLHKLASVGLSDSDLRTQLATALEIILSEFSHVVNAEKKGCIFVWERYSRQLKMIVHHQLTPVLVQKCDRLRPGECLCGQVAASREPLFVPGVDTRHTIHFQGMVSHGHYVLPIMDRQRLLGVLNLYTQTGQMPSCEDQRQLASVVNMLSVLIKAENSRALAALPSTTLWKIELKMADYQSQDILDASSKIARLLAKSCPDYAKYVSPLEELIINGIEHGICGITTEEKTALKGGVIGQPSYDMTRLDGQVWREEVNRRLRVNGDKALQIQFEQNDTLIRITITDPGHGFDVASFYAKRQEMLMHPNGRGIQVAETVFDDLSYNEIGNQVRVTIVKAPP
ncbi:MAG: ATP-binding protein [Magnetococcales bacterium]|nr:ATP-binding protein [Magnetococcales bacterium]MBF0116102.1 ATP-binding protein [Magnetococcales bacterium]